MVSPKGRRTGDEVPVVLRGVRLEPLHSSLTFLGIQTVARASRLPLLRFACTTIWPLGLRLVRVVCSAWWGERAVGV